MLTCVVKGFVNFHCNLELAYTHVLLLTTNEVLYYFMYMCSQFLLANEKTAL